MTMREGGVFVGIVTALLIADVILRAIVPGYDRGGIGSFDIALAIGATMVLTTRARSGQIAER